MSFAATQQKMPGVWFAARIAITLAIFAILWNAASGPEIIRVIASASPLWLAAAVAALLLQTVLSAHRWRVTAAQLGQDLSAPYAIKEYFLSQAFNQAVPGAIVGDAARAVRARQQGGLLVAGQAVFFERLSGQIFMFSTMAIAFVMTSLVAGGLEWPGGIATSIAMATVLGALIIIGSLWFGFLQSHWATKTRAGMRPLHTALLAKNVLPTQLGLGIAITICNLAAFGFAARAVGVEMSFIEIAALVPVVLFAMLVPLTISGWGVREGAAALVLPIAGISVADSVAASVMFGLTMLISVAPGALMVLRRS